MKQDDGKPEKPVSPYDGGERFRIVATSLVERGWNAAEIKQDVKVRYWHYAIPVDWDDSRLRQEIERCIVKVRPLETKPAAKADQISDDGLRSIDEAAPDDVAASDLRAVQRALASGRWRENSQAKEWAGHAVASVMRLDIANKAHNAKIASLL